ncbi:MAG: MATE family efflux transporter [Bacteroidetes bacterium]|nr:MAG: MATE family efflux transporter [Bacteroidota bacterium]TNE97600.1 MAG: MATE family efflux transporter [Bacteroidota bacterium]
MLEISYKRILKMAIPLMASSFIQSIVMITDSAFLSRYNTIDFDAAGNAGLLYITLYVILMGMSDGTQILMARRIGEERSRELPQLFGSALFLNFIGAIVLFAIAQVLMPPLIESIVSNNEIAVGEAQFVQYRSLGLFFSVGILAINAYFLSIGKTGVVLMGSLVIAIGNIALDYFMIFGIGSLPAMGLKGAALASTFAEALGLIYLLYAFLNNKDQKQHKIIRHLRVKKQSIIRLFKLSSPIMLQGLVALSTWTTFFIWIEQMGTHELTISQVIRSLYFLTFVPIWGFAGTTKTYVSQYVGKKDFNGVKLAQRKIQMLTILSLLLITHGMILYPSALVSLINPDPSIQQESIEILRFVFGSILIFGISSVYFQSISGTGNTRFTFIVELTAVFIYILSAYILIKVFHVSLFWVWSVEYIYFITLGLLSYSYLRFFKWQSKVL